MQQLHLKKGVGGLIFEGAWAYFQDYGRSAELEVHVTERWDVIAGHKLTLKSLVHIPAEEEENQQVHCHTTCPL